MNRREFLTAASSIVLAGSVRAANAPVGAAKLKIGILSDIHLEDKWSCGKLKTALENFRDRHVDGVLICGDLADHGIEPELKMLADIWFEVFPNDKLPDGSHVERLFHYGDHDTGGYAHTHKFFGCGERLMKRYGVTYDELCAMALRERRAEAWERLFGEKWEPIFLKRVKGYDFVLANWTPDNSNGGNNTPGMDKFFAEHKFDPNKPFFYSQHRVYRGTAGGPTTWGQDDGTTGKLLAKYPNCFAFCGHGHLSATDDRAIWQGEYTAIEVPSLRYVGLQGYHENKSVSHIRTKAGIPAQMKRLDCYAAMQGMLMTVYENTIIIDRIDFSAKDALAPSWIIPISASNRPYLPNVRRQKSMVPEFSAGAKATLTRIKVKEKQKDGEAPKVVEKFEVTFPLVQQSVSNPRPFDYEVALTLIQTGGHTETVVHKVFSPKAFAAPSRDSGLGKCVFAPEEFSVGGKCFYVQVWPANCFGKRGNPIEGEFVLK